MPYPKYTFDGFGTYGVGIDAEARGLAVIKKKFIFRRLKLKVSSNKAASISS